MSDLDPIVTCPDCKLIHYASEGCERCAGTGDFQEPRTKIRCPHCNGSGHALLSSLYQQTLELLKKSGRSTGAELARIDNCKATAMNMRLKVLEKYGLVKSEKDGRRTWYVPAYPTQRNA